MKFAVCLVALGKPVCERKAFEQVEGNISEVPLMAFTRHLPATTCAASITLTKEFADAHGSARQLLMSLCGLKGSKWKIQINSGKGGNKLRESKSRSCQGLEAKISNVASFATFIRSVRLVERDPGAGMIGSQVLARFDKRRRR